VATQLIAELQRRRVFRALIGYGIGAFAVLQIVEPIMHGLHWPDEVLSYVVVALAAGFPVVISLAWIFDVREGRIERTPPAEGLRRRWIAPLLVGIGVLTASPGLYYYLVVRARRPAPGPTSASIAVLPLVNLSRDPDQEYFADGLAEELLDLLAKVPGLHVAARTSAFSFKGKNDDARTIAEKLNVATLLEGSVRKSGDEVRITTQLISAKDGYHLWSETYDRKLTDVFAVQDEIARSVVAALRLQLLPDQRPRRAVNPEAYTNYLLGRQFFNRATLDGYRRAAKAYEKALEIDPGFAPALAGLAHTTYWLADSGGTSVAEIAEGQRRAREYADKAIALAPDLAEAYEARGSIRSATEWDWAGARADFQRALELSPENADALSDYALYVLRPLGLVQEGIASARKAAQLDPLNGRRWTTLGSALICAGRLDEARAALDRSLEINPEQAFAPGWLGLLQLLQGQPDVALQSFQRSTNEVFRLQGAAISQHALGHEAESVAALDALIARHSHDAAYQIATVYARRGDEDRAFEWLERARAQRDGGLTLLQVDPMMRSLRDDPRYKAFLKTINL
jgi:TolB-like protein/Tfp pilus assembly protein PilF